MDPDEAFADELCQPGMRAWEAIERARVLREKGESVDLAAAEESVRAALRGTREEDRTEMFLGILREDLAST